MRESKGGACAFVLESGRCSKALRDPINHCRVDQIVFGKTLLDIAAAIAPASTLLNDPCEQPSGRVVGGKRVRPRLRLLQQSIAKALRAEAHIFFKPWHFFFTEERTVDSAARARRIKRHHERKMRADKSISIFVGQLSRNQRAPVGSNGAEAPIAELRHQLCPDICDLPMSDPLWRW